MPDYSTWLTTSQTAAALKVTERTVARLVQRGKLHPKKVRIPGRQDTPLFDPAEIATYLGTDEPEQFALEPKKAALPVAVPAPPPATADAGQLAAFLAMLADQITARISQTVSGQLAERDTRVPISQRLYLTLAEASAYTGLPRGYLQQLIDAGQLRAVEVGKSGKGTRRRVARADLDALQL